MIFSLDHLSENETKNHSDDVGCRDLCNSCNENGNPVVQKLDEVIIIRCQCKTGYIGAFCDRKIGIDRVCFKAPIDLQ